MAALSVGRLAFRNLNIMIIGRLLQGVPQTLQKESLRTNPEY